MLSILLPRRPGGLASLGSILDSADSLICPVQRQHERGHVITQGLTKGVSAGLGSLVCLLLDLPLTEPVDIA